VQGPKFKPQYHQRKKGEREGKEKGWKEGRKKRKRENLTDSKTCIIYVN
jgi:hypothetical protein